jgi:outer membrane phospholipase A
MSFRLILCLLLGTAGAAAQDISVNLQAPLAAAAPGGEVRVNLVVLNAGPAATVFETPQTLAGTLRTDHRSWPVELRAQGKASPRIAADGFASRAFAFTLPAEARGHLILEVTDPQPARTLIEVATVAATDNPPEAAPAASTRPVPVQTAESVIKRSFAGRFSQNEPMYFIYGPKAPGAKFQFSFAYRLLGEPSGLGTNSPARRGLHVGYTQRSLWDITADSSPFYDTSYMPEILYESQTVLASPSAGGFQFLGYQVGLRHESNGQQGANSRSLNIGYVRPILSFGRLDGWRLLILPRVFAYVGDVRDNPDIRDYRGNAEVVASLSRNDSIGLSLTGRLGHGGQKGSLMTNLTIPIHSELLYNFATFFLVQYWTGYGESLRDYNKQTSTVRAGFSLVR